MLSILIISIFLIARRATCRLLKCFFFQTKNDPLKLFDSVVRVHNAVVRDVVCLDVRNVAERHDVISDGDTHEAMLFLEHHQLVSVSVQIAAKNASTCALLNQLFLCVHSFMQVYTLTFR